MKLPGTILRRKDAEPEVEADAGPNAVQATTQDSKDAAAQTTAQDAKGSEPGSGHTCPECKAPMAEDQDWCVQCGTNDEHNMRARASWYSAGALLAASAVLASGAAAAGVAALTQGTDHEAPHRPLLAQIPNNSVPTTPTTPVNPGTPETLKTPNSPTTTPAPTPANTTHTQAPAPAVQPSSTSPSSTESTTHTTTTTVPPEPIELQAQALSVYNPGGTYPAAALGDPRRNYEEGAQTLWSVQVQPPGASKLNVGLLVHLANAQRVGKIEVITSTPDYSLEVLGSTASKTPATITSLGWMPLGERSKLKRKATISLQHADKRLHYLVLWITSVPPSLAGTAGSPGQVTIDEVALFPPASG